MLKSGFTFLDPSALEGVHMQAVDSPLFCLVIADDFTGACDTGLQFTRGGFATRVFLTPEGVGAADAEIAVVDTESRNVDPDAAAQRVRQWTAALATLKDCLWYKKVDSTLRGPIGAEVKALMEGGGFELCLMAPALPAANDLFEGAP